MVRIKDGAAAVTDRFRRTVGHPVAQWQDHLEGPIGEFLQGTAQLPALAFRGFRHVRKGNAQ